MDTTLPNNFVAELRHWFLRSRRAFPWRENPSPYQVWISEVMLQQTQASRVIAFYERWIKRFPSVQCLAESSEEEVFKCWEGLGYYSRAKALRLAAIDLVNRFQGQLPTNQSELLSIKGLGPYTAGAIAAFAFHQKAAAVDGNVVRVLTRIFEIDADVGKIATQKKLREIAEKLLPDEEPRVISEALIELGACICRPKPNCDICPLQEGCSSFKNGTASSFPVKRQKTKYESLFREVVVIACGEYFLLRQGKKGQACAGLFEFPYFESGSGGLSADVLEQKIRDEFGLKPSFHSYLEEQFHSFTRFRVALYPKFFEVNERQEVPGHDWYSLEEAERLTFSSGHRRVLLSLFSK